MVVPDAAAGAGTATVAATAEPVGVDADVDDSPAEVVGAPAGTEPGAAGCPGTDISTITPPVGSGAVSADAGCFSADADTEGLVPFTAGSALCLVRTVAGAVGAVDTEEGGGLDCCSDGVDEVGGAGDVAVCD